MATADTTQAEALDEAAQNACNELGLKWRAGISADGTFHRLDVDGDRRGKADGSILLFRDGTGGMVRNWKTDEQLVFWASGEHITLSPAEKAVRQRQRDAAQKAADAERERRYGEAADKAKRLRFVASPASADHPYLKRKGVKIAGDVRQISAEGVARIAGTWCCGSVDLAGEILVVSVTVNDIITSIHMIDGCGHKAFLVGGRKQGGFWTAGELPDGDGYSGQLLICEGMATALSLHEAVGHAVIAAFDCGNLLPVAEAIRRRYPEAEIILAADDDWRATDAQKRPINPGAAAAQKAAQAVGGRWALPDFAGTLRPEKATDFNDLHALRGLEVVRQCVERAQAKEATPGEAASGAGNAKSDGRHGDQRSAGGTDSQRDHRNAPRNDRRPNGNGGSVELRYRMAADLTPEPVDWIWFGRIPCGKLSILAGHPGRGKSQLSIFIAAAISSGKYWPDAKQAQIGNVIILSAEDGAADTIIPRLMACGADRRRIAIIEAVTVTGEDGKSGTRTFSLREDLAALERMIETIGGASLIIIDPISSYMGKETDGHSNTDVRGVLEPVKELAERRKVAVLGITHFSKSGGGNAVLRFMGSLAFVAAARVGWAVVDEEDEEGQSTGRQLFLRVKGNLSGDPGGLAYRIEGVVLGKDHGLDQLIETSRIRWDGAVAVTVDEVLEPKNGTKAEPKEEAPALGEAKAFLTEILKDGLRAVQDVRDEAKGAGISWRTIERAKSQLRVISKKEGESWVWGLPMSFDQKNGETDYGSQGRQDRQDRHSAKWGEGVGGDDSDDGVGENSGGTPSPPYTHGGDGGLGGVDGEQGFSANQRGGVDGSDGGLGTEDATERDDRRFDKKNGSNDGSQAEGDAEPDDDLTMAMEPEEMSGEGIDGGAEDADPAPQDSAKEFRL